MLKNVFLMLLVVGLVVGSGNAQEYPVIDVGTGGRCQWSSNGHLLSYMLGWDLFLYDVDADSSIKLGVMPGESYAWIGDSQFVFLKTEVSRDTYPWTRNSRLSYVSIGSCLEGEPVDSAQDFSYVAIGSPSLISDHTGTVALRVVDSLKPVLTSEFHRKSESRRPLFAYSNYPPIHHRGKSIFADTDIWLYDAFGNRMKQVTRGKEYSWVILSPSGARIACRTIGGHLIVIDTSGSLIADLGQNTFHSWSWDSEFLYFVRIEQGEWDIIAGDLYRYSFGTRDTLQLTSTPEKIELRPVASPDNTMLAYSLVASPINRIQVLVLEGGSK